MKNINEQQKKKCIFCTVEEFETAVKAAMQDNSLEFEYSLDGLSVMTDHGEDIADMDEIHAALSAYYGVEVTSIHLDDYTPVGVWIVYKDKEEKNPAYTVTFTYSFDEDSSSYLFETYEEAKKFLKESFEEELRIEIEENRRIPDDCQISETGCYARIVEGEDVTEWHLTQIYL